MIAALGAFVGALVGRKVGRPSGASVEREIARRAAWAEWHRQQAWAAYWAAQRHDQSQEEVVITSSSHCRRRLA